MGYILLFNHLFLSSVRYSLTEEGLALAERLESVEKWNDDGPPPERDRNRGKDGKEVSPGVVDLTGGDDDEEEEEEEDRIL